ncbi:NfeD family protein [Paracoccus marinaquae]|uniref:NfeD-like C-terminal domain-containing protein n=1 Tax=Paracoccus marinaquae TaxID=2841926 RepID=A0ABS6AH07_9RHOB|nr:hypothetical protein [Paracoccus marinaquae]MBU3028656.1 hypothetical protein [Paracoccus marinaquae]
MNWLNGWLWIVLSLVLAVLELFAPGWVFMGLAAAVGLMGILLLTGLWSAGLPMTLVATALLSGLAWYLLRRVAGVKKGQVRIWDRDIND